MKKKITAIVLASLMIIGMVMQVNADFVPLTTVLYDGDLTSSGDELGNWSTNGNKFSSNGYTAGDFWLTSWGIGSSVEKTNSGFEFKTIAANGSVDPSRRVLLNKTQKSHSDMVMTTKFETKKFGAYNVDGSTSAMQLWFTFNGKKVQPFAYKALNGTIAFAGKNKDYWSAATEESFQLEENTAYVLITEFLYNSGSGKYDLKYTLKDGECANQIGNSVTVSGYDGTDGTFDDIASLNDEILLFSYGVGTTDENAKTGSETYITVKSVKLENQVREHIINFDAVKYNDGGTRLNEAMGDIDLSALKDKDDSSKSTPGYLAGNSWGTSYKTTDEIFSSDGEWLSVNTATETGKYVSGNLSKRYINASNGDTVKLSSVLRVYKRLGSSSKADDIHIRLSGNDQFITLFNLNTCNDRQGQNISLGGINQDVTAYSRPSKTYAATTGFDWNLNDYMNATGSGTLSLKLEAILCPSQTEGKYDVSITLYNNDTNKELLNAKVELDKNVVLNYNQFDIVTFAEGAAEGQTRLKIKDTEIEVEKATLKTGLTVGENSIYIPYTNVTKNPFDVAAVAAVYDENGMQIDFAIAEEKSVIANDGFIKISGVTISDPSKETAKVFIFNTFEDIKPWTEAKPLVMQTAE